jgi:hypothetical protein
VKVDECDYVFIFMCTLICSYQKQIIDDHSNSSSLQWSHIINFQFGRFSYFFPKKGQGMSLSPPLILLVFKSIHFVVSLSRLIFFQRLVALLQFSPLSGEGECCWKIGLLVYLIWRAVVPKVQRILWSFFSSSIRALLPRFCSRVFRSK